jgi:ATP adenylyltransferase
MTYHQLQDFLLNRMRMSHIYQPVMIRCLLENQGRAEDIDIAKELLLFDPTSIEYYQNITNNMVGKVLRSHHIVEKNKKEYYLPAFNNLTSQEISFLIEACNQKIDEYIRRRGEAIWQHRSRIRGYVPGSIRYEVLKRAEFRCELCGISAKEKALEVDHIIPVNKGGVNAIENYQALCYSCNATKRDTDSTDFRDNIVKYQKRIDNCLFCGMENKRIVFQNELAYMILDKYPVTNLHCLIIPKRHSSDFFEINQAELNATKSLIHRAKEYIVKNDRTVEGFNIGYNCGHQAGQTVMHTHLHVIPRRNGDVEEPIGGIRNVIPGMGKY